MATTQQTQESKDKQAIQGIDIRALNEFLSEDDEGATRTRRVMEKIYTIAMEGNAQMLKLLADKIFPNIQSVDMTTGGEKIHTVLLDIFQDDKNNKETE